jgi:hypothetical protein
MRLATDRIRQTLKPASFCTSPRLAVIRLAPRTNHLRSVPLGSMVLDAFGALGIAAAAASLQGFHPSAGWGTPSSDFSTCGVPGSLGLHPPWGIPLPGPWPLGCYVRSHDRRNNSVCTRLPRGRGSIARPPLAFREGTLLGTVPCASSFKDPGNRLASSETAGP